VDNGWFLTKIQDLTIPLNPATIILYPNSPTYVVQNVGVNTFPGIIADRSINSNSTTISAGLKLVTYRTYFNLPNLSTTTSGYSLSFKTCADDAVDNIRINGVEKAKYLDVNYNVIPGVDKPYLLNIPICNEALVTGQNYIDVTIADAGGLIGFYGEIILSETTSACASTNSVKENIMISNFFSIFPNPSHNVLNINFDNQFASSLVKDVLISIHSIDGKLIESETILKSKFKNSINLNIETLSNGFYTLKITSGNFSQNVKFIKE